MWVSTYAGSTASSGEPAMTACRISSASLKCACMIRSIPAPDGGTSGLGFSFVDGSAVPALGSGGAGATDAGAAGAEAGGGDEPPQAISPATTAHLTAPLH